MENDLRGNNRLIYGSVFLISMITAVAIAMIFGFQNVLIIAGISYLSLSLIVRSYPKENRLFMKA